MSTQIKNEIIKEIERLWSKKPSLRFNQFIYNITKDLEVLSDIPDAYYITDKETLKYLKEMK